jgi:LmbE family N-acetylglucosaminyl deacetylase
MDAHDFFKAADQLPHADTKALLGDGGLLVIAPHPDDESLGCGALIAAAADEKRPISIIVVTDGAGSHPNSKQYPSQRLRALREEESLAGVAALGVESGTVRFLALPDRAAPAVGPAADTAVDSIVEEAHKARAAALFVTWRNDAHADHQASYKLARRAQEKLNGVRLLEYSIWGRDLPPEVDLPTAPSGRRFSVEAFRSRKEASIFCYRSQVSDLITDDPYHLPAKIIRRAIDLDEVFLEMPP